MCHGWEYELIRKTYAQEVQRRRDKEEAATRERPSSGPVPEPFDPQPQVRVKTPIPA